MGYTLIDEAGAPAKGTYTLLPDEPQAPKKKGFGEQLNAAISDVPRQLGLTARYGLEGLGGIADLVTSPIRGALNIAGMNIKPGMGQVASNAIGLPQPQNGTERIVGDATRMVAGGLLPMGAGAALARNGSGVAQGVGRMLASNPGQQLASAAAAGAAGGYTRETGGGEGAQLASSLAAGIATPFAMGGVQRLAQGAARLAAGRPPAPPMQVDVTINNALENSGFKLSDLPADVAKGIRADVVNALKISDDLSPDAVRRLADFRITGTVPTAASLTLDPAMVTQQRNLAKLGINSKDPVAQQLGQTQNANNRQLTAGLNTLGANTTDDAIAGGGKVMEALSQRNDRAQGIINSLYDKARDSSGRSAALDHVAFTNKAGDLLHEANVESFLTPDIRSKLNGFATGDIPLNVDIAEQFKTSLGKIQRNSADGNVRTAIGLVRQALDDTPLQNRSAPTQMFGGNQISVPGGIGSSAGQNLGQEALDAFSKARRMNRSWMQIVERTPALQAVRDGIEPDKFVQQFIVGTGPKANAMDVAMLKNSIKGSPDAMNAVKQQVTAYLKQKALNNAADEVGNFSQSAYNKALNAIGDRKLTLFFSKPEIDQMKAIGRVASYEQFQPAGSAINNSNTASAGMAAMLDRIGSSSLLSKVPFGKVLAEPLQNIAIGLQASKSLNVPRALSNGMTPQQQFLPPPGSTMVSPSIFMGTDTEEAQRLREAGLLPP